MTNFTLGKYEIPGPIPGGPIPGGPTSSGKKAPIPPSKPDLAARGSVPASNLDQAAIGQSPTASTAGRGAVAPLQAQQAPPKPPLSAQAKIYSLKKEIATLEAEKKRLVDGFDKTYHSIRNGLEMKSAPELDDVVKASDEYFERFVPFAKANIHPINDKIKAKQDEIAKLEASLNPAPAQAPTKLESSSKFPNVTGAKLDALLLLDELIRAKKVGLEDSDLQYLAKYSKLQDIKVYIDMAMTQAKEEPKGSYGEIVYPRLLAVSKKLQTEIAATAPAATGGKGPPPSQITILENQLADLQKKLSAEKAILRQRGDVGAVDFIRNTNKIKDQISAVQEKIAELKASSNTGSAPAVAQAGTPLPGELNKKQNIVNSARAFLHLKEEERAPAQLLEEVNVVNWGLYNYLNDPKNQTKENEEKFVEVKTLYDIGVAIYNEFSDLTKK